ncbi:helix-turn-helix domain-containing protein [Caenispirillum bisanense]|uniref:AraC-type DNA-binding protein n=1 Tax=Caenispirillum bisanense TaxID=414052 RepID=A0A286GL10_9PROT|nr:helix-turn-helix domain-containing protein [Caenispirillum bisanense]SOD96237.1 AraC-type DNA-binding protein [Caenispirillum bisanense]
MNARFTTENVTPAQRAHRWREIVGATYFPLEITIPRPETFGGSIAIDAVGPLSISRHQSSGLAYRRDVHHLRKEREEQFLITVPEQGEVDFTQCGHDVRCGAGGFILQRSHEPYEFSHRDASALWVVKVPSDVLRSRLRAPDRFCALRFDAQEGAGALFVDFLRLLPRRLPQLGEEGRAAVGGQVLDLLVLALQDDARVLDSAESVVRAAHLQRIESFVRRNLHDPDLSPQRIAAGCGISVRYLHQLFRDTGMTVNGWVREQRLLSCHAALTTGAPRRTIAEIAYSWGFADQAQFSRAFRSRFGTSPSDVRRRAG